ncbi:radial spoke 3 [Neocallimastix californiae]|uniref:Radial spoke 3 n=1 Tax=Neocallimastix californiae TaxID=1754190 RepID=A0A1Y2C1E4_9FUNG|nr:radial spoke 3 [Neocallimastix californiae]|eukprot:ORY40862.1 radial spoke 3 [Neocallimastix californiae]
MYDPRVVRGNTYAAKNLPLHSEPDPLERHKQEEMKRRAKARKRAAEKRRIKTPEPVEGRRHVEVQTDLYLEELYDKVPEAIAATQTDLFLDRAPSPLYIPQKSGIDAATQIYDGELFDFNFEVEPILEVLVGKTLEQALIEVMEEEELEMLRKHQVEFEEKRNAELAEVQRLEDAERRRTDEKNRRIAEKLKLMEEKKEVAEKIAARSFTNAYLSNLIPSVFETLNDNGFFYDPRETEIENYFLPWLTHKSNNYVDKIRTSRLLLDHIILDSIRQLNSIGRPILRGLKERKIKKQKKYVSREDWMDPEMIFKCVESKPSNY